MAKAREFNDPHWLGKYQRMVEWMTDEEVMEVYWECVRVKEGYLEAGELERLQKLEEEERAMARRDYNAYEGGDHSEAWAANVWEEEGDVMFVKDIIRGAGKQQPVPESQGVDPKAKFRTVLGLPP